MRKAVFEVALVAQSSVLVCDGAFAAFYALSVVAFEAESRRVGVFSFAMFFACFEVSYVFAKGFD